MLACGMQGGVLDADTDEFSFPMIYFGAQDGDRSHLWFGITMAMGPRIVKIYVLVLHLRNAFCYNSSNFAINLSINHTDTTNSSN